MRRSKTTSHVVAILLLSLSQATAGGDCRSYAGTACREALETGQIYHNHNGNDGNEEKLVDIFDRLDDSDSLEPGCRDFAKTLLCHLVFPYCGDDGSSSGRPVCFDDCRVGRDDVCRSNQWSLIGALSQGVFSNFDLLECGGDAFGNETGRNGGDEPECSSQVWKPQANYSRKEDAATCYVGIGRGYAGKLATTRSGYSCQSWESQSPHAHPSMINGQANYCRNPEGLAEKPWCYTTNASVRWEECAVPKCDPKVKCVKDDEFMCREAEFAQAALYVNTSEVESPSDMSSWLVSFYRVILPHNLNETCLSPLADMMCFFYMPQCDPSTPEPRREPICREYCESVRDGACRNYWAWIQEVIERNPQLKLIRLPVCDRLPSQYNEESPECVLEPRKPEYAPTNTTDCYSDSGDGYVGSTSATESGLTCQAWKSQYPHVHLTRNPPAGNACRNPGGRRKRPWCYTTDTATRWEYCDISKCRSAELHYRYTVASVVGSVSLLVLLGICVGLCVCQKKQGKFRCCCTVGDEKLLTEDDYLGEILIPRVKEMEMASQRNGNGSEEA